MPSKVPAAPPGLGDAGATLWRQTVDSFELAEHELVLLEQICHTIDAISILQQRLDAADVLDERYNGRVHPCLPELRQQRLALGRLLRHWASPALRRPVSRSCAASVGRSRRFEMRPRIKAGDPSEELKDFAAWAAARNVCIAKDLTVLRLPSTDAYRGAVADRRRCWEQWRAARAWWSETHDWPGGEEARCAEEVCVAPSAPFNPDTDL